MTNKRGSLFAASIMSGALVLSTAAVVGAHGGTSTTEPNSLAQGGMMGGQGMHTQMGGMMGGQGMMGVDPETMADLQSQMADFHQQMIDLHLEFMGAANPVDSTDDAGEAASSGDAELPAVTDS